MTFAQISVTRGYTLLFFIWYICTFFVVVSIISCRHPSVTRVLRAHASPSLPTEETVTTLLQTSFFTVHLGAQFQPGCLSPTRWRMNYESEINIILSWHFQSRSSLNVLILLFLPPTPHLSKRHCNARSAEDERGWSRAGGGQNWSQRIGSARTYASLHCNDLTHSLVCVGAIEYAAGPLPPKCRMCFSKAKRYRSDRQQGCAFSSLPMAPFLFSSAILKPSTILSTTLAYL